MQRPGSLVGTMAEIVGVRVTKGVVMIRAKLESASPDRTQYKPYAPTLTFENVYVDIPVPAENVTPEKGDKIVLDVDGLAITLDVVATAIEKMNTRWTQSFNKPGQHRPF
jgi:hypothetical protein